MKHAGSLLVVGIIHRTGTINMASICAFSDGALTLARNRNLAAKLLLILIS